MLKQRIKILELFGGIGSPRRALMNIGVDVKSIDYVEIDQKAVDSYNAMFEKEMKQQVQSVVKYDLKPDILVHGSPCQDFSIAGHQKGADEGSETRSSLMWETIHIIEQMGVWKPRIVIWENVKNVTSKYMIANFNRYLSEMSKMGYANSFEILDARDFGLPQKRKRVITVSILGGDPFDFSDLIKKKTRNISEFLETNVPEHYTVTQPSMIKMIDGTSESVFNGRIDIIKNYCNTISCKQMRCPNSGVVDIGNGKFRYLTERECWRLQGYEDKDFDSALSKHPGKRGKLNGALYKQAGNSIPVVWFESIFRKLLFDEVDTSVKSINQMELKYEDEDNECD